MQKDFHYYVTAMLARYAGFTPDQSRLIAWCSQYVDDATESFQLHLSNGRVVETTMTAHYHVKSFSTGVQRDVYECFHFPPAGLKNGTFSFRTQPDPPVLKSLLEDILKEKETGSGPLSNEGHPFWMYRLGIALHTYMDSWSHQSFSGRLHRENDVGRIYSGDSKGNWKRMTLEDWMCDLAPSVGHCQAGHLVDHPHRHLKYQVYDPAAGSFRMKVRHNPVQFEKASKHCLKQLRKFSGSGSKWDDNEDAMKAIRFLVNSKMDDAEERIMAFKKHRSYRPFRKLFSGKGKYDENGWPDEAFATIDDRPLKRAYLEKQRERFHARERDGFDGTNFRLFHKAARKQRVFMLDRLFW